MTTKLTRPAKAPKIGPLHALSLKIAAMTPEEREAWDKECAANAEAAMVENEKQRANHAAQIKAEEAAIRAAVKTMLLDTDLYARIQRIAEIIAQDDRNGFTGRGHGVYREHGVERTETAILQVSGVLRGFDKADAD